MVGDSQETQVTHPLTELMLVTKTVHNYVQ